MHKIIVSHPTGNAFVRAAADSFLYAGYLEKLYTSVAVFPGSFLYKSGHLTWLADIRRRSFSKPLQPFIQTYPFYETGRLLSDLAGFTALTKHEKGIFSIDNVYRKLDGYVAGRVAAAKAAGADTVYCYEDGALQTFGAAKANGLQCIYDLPIGYWRTMHRLLEVEKEIHPQWAGTITGFYDSPEKLQRKEDELALADHIIVASSFTAETLKDYPGKIAPVSVIPYGFPPVCRDRSYQGLDKRPLKILFVGSLSQRKGIANLLEAIAPFNKRVELTIVGNKVVKNCVPLNAALARHTWIPSLPQEDTIRLMRQQDVLVFPSLFEGFGLVITEAMSQGTPVITTERTAGPDIITDKENGWLTEAGNTTALSEAIAAILTNPAMLQQAGRAAIETASKRPWQVYGKELLQQINTL